MPGISENYGSPLEGMLSDRRIRLGRRTACRYDNVSYFGGTAAWPNHAFRRTLHLRQRDILRRVSISWATRYRARARRGITRAVKAPRSSGSCSTYANPTAVCIYARSSSTSGARETSLRKRPIDPSGR